MSIVGYIVIGIVILFLLLHKYKVAFTVNGEEYIEEAELKNRTHKVGDIVEVRYDISKKGKVHLVSEAFLCWTREMAIGYTLGMLWGMF